MVGGHFAFSKGVWKDVAIVGSAAGSAAIELVAARTFYNSSYPTTPLWDDDHGDFTVNVDVHLWAPPGGAVGTLSVEGDWSCAGSAVSMPVSLPAGNSSIRAVLSAANNSVRLWWPAQTPGNRSQARYSVNVTFTPSSGGAPIAASRMIGFRTLYLVTGNDTDPSTLNGTDGQSHWTMRVKVNGADVWARGANHVPMTQLEALNGDEGHRRLVRSAVDGGFNMIRVWGGGLYEFDAFYDTCDELGILLYHDLAYAKWIGAPNDTPLQRAELLYSLRRLAHHPSIAIWDGCSECGGHGGYASFLMTVTAAEDPSRPPWPSCPSMGWAHGVDALTGLPNGSPLGLQPHVALRRPAASEQCDPNAPYEYHGGYLKGEGAPTVNSAPSLQPFNLTLPSQLPANATPTGPNECPGSFFSEFGTTAPSSFESMSGALAPSDWGLHSEGMRLRNYASDNAVVAASNASWPASFEGAAGTGVSAFSRQLYFAMLTQAIMMKATIELHRAQAVWGTLIWMFAENWPTGGWGSVEYGPAPGPGATPGQIEGGRWKVLHYWLRRFLYRDAFITVSSDGRLFVRSDDAFATSPLSGTAALTMLHLATGATSDAGSRSVALPRAGAGASMTLCADANAPDPSSCTPWAALLPAVGCAANGSDCALLMELRDGASGVVVAENFALFAPPFLLSDLPRANVTIVSVGPPSGQPPSVTAPIVLHSDAVALFVHLTTGAPGRFADNSVILRPGNTTIEFIAWGALDVELLSSTLRVEHVSAYGVNY